MNESIIAVIGSCVCDVILRVPSLPKTTNDVNISSQKFSIGGCAFNCAHMLSLFDVPYVLFAPIGQGIYGDFVRQQLHIHHMQSLLDPVDESNGCCYCLVEPSGERTFLSYHGCEYLFHADMFTKLEPYHIDTLYICGLELEEDTGIHILNYIKQRPYHIYFAPGPRFSCIQAKRLEELWALHPILHLNQDELLCFTKQTDIQIAMQSLYACTQNTIIVTCGEQGAYLYDGGCIIHQKAPQVSVVDTIGAGDAHIAAFMAARQCGYSKSDALYLANHIASSVVQTAGSTITKEMVANIRKKLTLPSTLL